MLILGAFTIVIGVISWWMIVDFPSEAKFLTPEEKELVRRRLEADGQHGARDEKFQWRRMRESFEDWKTWTGMVMYMGVDGALYAFSLFLPTIIKNMGYATTKAQLMSVPPYAFACILVRLLIVLTHCRQLSWDTLPTNMIGAVSSTLGCPQSGSLDFLSWLCQTISPCPTLRCSWEQVEFILASPIQSRG
jgi:hypothetical protein